MSSPSSVEDQIQRIAHAAIDPGDYRIGKGGIDQAPARQRHEAGCAA
ncbi:MAG: hypothetical protein ACJ79U_15540 [Myxococcales bacterium]